MKVQITFLVCPVASQTIPLSLFPLSIVQIVLSNYLFSVILSLTSMTRDCGDPDIDLVQGSLLVLGQQGMVADVAGNDWGNQTGKLSSPNVTVARECLKCNAKEVLRYAEIIGIEYWQNILITKMKLIQPITTSQVQLNCHLSYWCICRYLYK